MSVEILSVVEAERHRAKLAVILADCVGSGASISFMLPFDEAQASDWWVGVIASVAADQTVLLGAYLDGELVGSVQLGLDMPPNQPHRGDVKKLIVSREARGRGCGAALMQALEAEARRRGLTLLVLDTAGAEAERLYRRLGWTEAGTIPGYAMWPTGGFCDTILFWKRP